MFGMKYLQRSYDNDSMGVFLWKYTVVGTLWGWLVTALTFGGIMAVFAIVEKREEQKTAEPESENDTV